MRARENTRQPGSIHPWPVPEGHLRIAQRFNVGGGSRRRISPEGTVEGALVSAVPSGLIFVRDGVMSRYLLAGSFVQSTPISSRMNLANGRIFWSAEAASSASRYSLRRVARTIVQG
jgi:hypothetical protein